MAENGQEPQRHATGAAPSTPPEISQRDRVLSFVQDQLASSMANAAQETSMYGKTTDISEIIKVVSATPDLKVGLHVPEDKITSVAGQPNFTRLEMQVGSNKEIMAIPNAQLEQLGALPNVAADGRLQPQQHSAAPVLTDTDQGLDAMLSNAATKQKASSHPLANHPEVMGAIANLRNAAASSSQQADHVGSQAVAGTGQSTTSHR